jgi:hypothetical protein
VCSPHFDEISTASAFAAAAPSTLVVDALLDQSLLPGVGNIIKNEALHRSAIDPRRTVGQCSPAEVETLVHEARQFSMAWFRSGRHPPCSVYNRSTCADCGAAVALFKFAGSGAPRPTFWCAVRCSGGNCRQAGANAGSETGAKRVGKRAHGAGVVDAIPKDPWAAAAKKPRATDTAAMSAFASAPMVAAPMAAALMVATPMVAVPMVAAPMVAAPMAAAPMAAAPMVAAPIPTPVIAPAKPSPCDAPQCLAHGRARLALKRVRKAGANAGRLFYACRGGGCQHFAWADQSFPMCSCATAVTVALRISKQEHSGGRWFFGCRSANRCSFFEWAPAAQLARFGTLLSPLT